MSTHLQDHVQHLSVPGPEMRTGQQLTWISFLGVYILIDQTRRSPARSNPVHGWHGHGLKTLKYGRMLAQSVARSRIIFRRNMSGGDCRKSAMEAFATFERYCIPTKASLDVRRKVAAVVEV